MPSRRALSSAVITALVLPTLSLRTTFADPLLSSWTPIYSGIDYATGTDTLVNLNVDVLRVDLSAQGVSFVTTPKYTAQPGFDTFSQTTGDFLVQQNAQVAVNANFFSVVSSTPQPQNLFGLAISRGTLVSAPEQNNPALTLSATNQAALVTTPTNFDYSNVYNAVAGNLFLVQNGVNVAPPTADNPSFNGLNPRTVAGLSQDSRYLYLMTIDGRTAASVGTSLIDTANWALTVGAYNAINLDGGGSTTMARSNGSGGYTLLNNPSGGTQRLNGNNLAVYANALPTPPPPPGQILWNRNASGAAVDGTGTWDTAGSNWNTGGTTNRPWNNSIGDTAVFGNSGTAGVITLATPITAGGLTFNPLTGTNNAYTIGSPAAGQSLTLLNNAIVNNNNTAATSTINANLSLSSNTTFTGTGALTVAGAISGSAVTLSKTGTGTLTLTATNSLSGSVVISGGTLSPTVTTALGTTSVTVAATGTLNLINGTANVFIPNPITLAGGTLRVFGPTGTATNSNQVFSNTITLAAGNANTIAVQAQSANGNGVRITGKLTGPGGFTFDSLSSAGPGLELSNPANDFQGDITLTPSNKYFYTLVSDVIPDTAVLNNNRARGQGGWGFNAAQETLAGLTGTGDIFFNSGPSSQTLRIGNNAGRDLSYDGNLGRNGPIKLVKFGSNVQTFTNTSNYPGGTEITGGFIASGVNDGATTGSLGTLGQVPASATANSLVLNGGGFRATASITLHPNRGLSISTSGGTLDITGSSSTLTYAGVLANFTTTPPTTPPSTPGTLTKSGPGTLLLSGVANTFSGPISITGGTLRLSGSSANNLPNVPSITLSPNTILDVTGLTSSTFTLQSNQTLAGTGTINGNLSTASPTSRLAPSGTSSAIGMLVTNNLNITNGATLAFDLGTLPGTADRINVNSALTLPAATGRITLSLSGLTEYSAGTYTLFTFGSLTGGLPTLADTFTFANVAPKDLPYLRLSRTGTTSGAIILTVIPEPSAAALLAPASLLTLRRRRFATR